MGTNEVLAKIFFEIANVLEMKKVLWKPQAYRRAARVLENFDKDVKEIYKKQGLEGLNKIPGIGKGISNKIAEFIETGKIKEYKLIREKIPKSFYSLLEIPGLGLKKAQILYNKLGITNLKQLQNAAELHKIASLPGFKEKTEEEILENIKLINNYGKTEKKPLKQLLKIANSIVKEMRKSSQVEKIDIAGSIRRKKPFVRDIDLIATGKNAGKIIDYFTKLKKVKKILGKGEKKATVILNSNIQVDIRFFSKDEYGSGLLYSTGSKEHSIELRKIAMKKSMKLSEYGLFKKTNKGYKKIAGKSEAEIYQKLGLKYIPPELREGKYEIKGAGR